MSTTSIWHGTIAPKALAAIGRDPWAASAAREVLRRADAAVAVAELEPRAARPRWWHVVWEQLSDVAFAQAIEPTATRARWLHDRLLTIARLDADAWIGPAFRPRTEPRQGQLETAHVAIALTTALELAPDVLDAIETAEVTSMLRSAALPPIEAWLEAREAAGRLNNWYMVMTDGLVAAAFGAGVDRPLRNLPDRLAAMSDLIETDSYGESLQYWGYAALHMVELHARLSRAEPVIARLGLEQRDLDDLLLEPLARCLPWVSASMVAMPGDLSDLPLLAVNLGDSARTWRPPAEVLAVLAARDRADPTDATLAAYLLERCYPLAPVPTPSELSTFGFFPSAGWRAVLTAADRVSVADPPLPPAATTFSVGTTLIRSNDPAATVLAAQTGHPPLRTTSHRHADAGSFVLAYAGRMLLADPGHCTYRLTAYRTATAPHAHSTWTFTTQAGEGIEQRPVESIAGRRPAGPVPIVEVTDLGELRTFTADLADAYSRPVTLARRTWFTLMPHVVLIHDQIEATEPVAVTTRFVTDNTADALDTNVATPSRLVLRRDGVACKLLRLESLTESGDSAAPVTTSTTALHDTYDPLPLSSGQGREGTGIVQSFTTAASRQHVATYVLVAAAEPHIRGWHADLEGEVIVVSDPHGRRVRIDPRARW